MAVDHTVKAYLAPLARLGIDFTPAPPMMALPSAAISFANGFFKGRELVAATSIIALCPGASHHEKKWPFRYFADVARKLLEDAARGVVVVSATEDHIPERLEIEHQRLAAARDFDILRVAAILSKCRVALTNDSGLMHLANAVGVPVLAIFGPTNPRLGFAPTLPGSRVICDDVVCSPCSVHGQRPCYQPEKYCFKDITPERVFDELKEMSNRTNSAAS
jgi:heptosyltransferase-2